jgi:hypothetical protein
MASRSYTRVLFAHKEARGFYVSEPDLEETWVIRDICVYLRESVPGPNVLIAGPEGAYIAKFAPTNVESITGDESLHWEGRVAIEGATNQGIQIEVENGPADVTITGYVFTNS